MTHTKLQLDEALARLLQDGISPQTLYAWSLLGEFQNEAAELSDEDEDDLTTLDDMLELNDDREASDAYWNAILDECGDLLPVWKGEEL